MLKKLFLIITFICLFNFSESAYCQSIIAFGDSITQGYPYVLEPGKGRRIGGYEPYLESLLNIPVLNYGVGGENSGDGLDRIESVLLDNLDASIVIILEGTNDGWWGVNFTKENLRGMVRICRKYNKIPILMTLTPDSRYPEKNLYNIEIRKLAHEEDVFLIDLYEWIIAYWDFLTYDGLHPNLDGYEYIAKIIAHHISN